jgi:2-oxoglutarate/2-oxoacid ferredoxin oxidoreductase subunit alpha
LSRVKYMQGNEAMAEGAFYAGATFYAGYPITPSSEIAEISSQRLPALGGVYMQMEDEIASMAAMIGASLAGRKAFTATSGPGFSLMQENLGLAKMLEVPCVLINVMRCGPSTALATRPAQADVLMARWGTHGDSSVIALSPATVQDCFDLTVAAFNLSERFRTPVILLGDEVVGHMREGVRIPEPGEIPIYPRRLPETKEGYLPYGAGSDGVAPLAMLGHEPLLHVTSSMHDETGRTNNDPGNAGRLISRLSGKIEDHVDEITRVRTFGDDDAEILLVSYGSSARAARSAVQLGKREGLRVRLVELLTLWPFPAKLIEKESMGRKLVFVCEMNLGQMVREVRGISKSRVESIHKANGEPIEPAEVLEGIKGVSR